MNGFWPFGYRRLFFPQSQRTEVFRLAFRHRIVLRGEREEKPGRGDDGPILSVRVRESEASQLFRLQREAGLDVRLGGRRGFSKLFAYLRRHPGILAGALLSAALMIYASSLVWDIRIEGNETVASEEILSELEKLDFTIGTRFHEVNFDALKANYAAAQNDIAWLSVYMDGTVARVQVWEMKKGDSPRPSPSPNPPAVCANVVAARDGVVESLRLFNGQRAVREGELVREGQVLISGVVEKKDGGVRYEYAVGEVYATVSEAISVEVPLERVVMKPTGRKKRCFTVKIFEKTIKVFENSGIGYASCDTIDTIGRLCPFGVVPLPLWFGVTTTVETEPSVLTLTEEEAEEEARRLMRQRIREQALSGQLAEKSVRMEKTPSGIRLDAVLTLTKDIAKTAEFRVESVNDVRKNP